MILNIPIILTLIRIVAIPVFVLVFYIPVHWSNLVVTVIFCVAAITDWLDGYLARRWQQTSAFGAFLDPVADKLMVTCALVLLVDRNPTHFPGYVMAIPAGVIIGREIVISALREWMAELGKRAHVAVSIIGKFKTGAQMLAIPFLLYAQPIYGMPITMTGLVLIYISAVLTIWSMFIYLRASWPVLMKSK